MRIETILGRLFRRGSVPDPQVRAALADELARAFSSPPPRRRWRRLGGLALGGALLAGACVVPTDYELAMGMRMVVTLIGSPHSFDPEALGRQLESEFAPAQMRIMVAASSGAPEGVQAPRELKITLDLVGDLDPDAVERSARAHFPALREADIEVQALDGTVHGTLGGLISERTFGLKLDRGSVEETRARILEELAAQGLEGTATIEIQDEETLDGHRREVRVRVEAEDRG